MKKVLHMHSNIFDSTHQREIKSTDNVFGKMKLYHGSIYIICLNLTEERINHGLGQISR